MNCELIAPIQNLNVSKALQLAPGRYLFEKGALHITEIFRSNRNLVDRIGNEAIEDISKDPNMLIVGSLEDLQSFTGSNNTNIYALVMATEVMGYLTALWFVKDNSCYCPEAFLLTENRTRIRSHSFDNFLSNAVGEYETVTFSLEEISRAVIFREKLYELFGTMSINDHTDFARSVKGSGDVSAAEHQHFIRNRIERAYLMLSVARSTSDLAMKLSFYMSTLECMFTTDGSEISNKIVQRVTLFIGGDKDEMLKNKDVIKKAYSIRSGFLHGSKPKAKLTTKQSLVEISTAIDSIIRVVFLKVVETESKWFLSKEERDLDNYFDSFVYR